MFGPLVGCLCQRKDCALPVSGHDTTADYGMGLVPIFCFEFLKSAAMDGPCLTLAIKDDRKSNNRMGTLCDMRN